MKPHENVFFKLLQYAAVCNAVCRDGPNIIAVLEKLDSKVETLMEDVENKVNFKNKLPILYKGSDHIFTMFFQPKPFRIGGRGVWPF